MSARPHLTRRPHQGFTLAELIVVIVIIAILALIAVPSFVSSLKTSVAARDAASLGAFGRDALTTARSEGSSAMPTTADFTSAAAEMPTVPVA